MSRLRLTWLLLYIGIFFLILGDIECWRKNKNARRRMPQNRQALKNKSLSRFSQVLRSSRMGNNKRGMGNYKYGQRGGQNRQSPGSFKRKQRLGRKGNGKSFRRKGAQNLFQNQGPPKSMKCPKNNYVAMNCLSCPTKVDRQCQVNSALQITQITIAQEFSKGSKPKCKRGKSYGFTGSYVWVTAGCRARFDICYDKQTTPSKTISCGCKSMQSSNTCPLGLSIKPRLVIVIMLFKSQGSGKCKKDDTWGNNSRDIWVKKGCSAIFKVTWIV